MKYKPSYLVSLVLSIVALFAFFCPSARATYIATLQEVGTDVVGTGSGSLDITDLTKVFDLAGAPRINPLIADFRLGDSPMLTRYNLISGPTSFGSGGQATANTGTGNEVGIITGNQLDVPFGYISGTPLGVSTDTWNNKTFASLGITPGTYVWTWGTGIHADSYTLQIGPTNGVPETGSTIVLLLGAVGTLCALRGKLAARIS